MKTAARELERACRLLWLWALQRAARAAADLRRAEERALLARSQASQLQQSGLRAQEALLRAGPARRLALLLARKERLAAEMACAQSSLWQAEEQLAESRRRSGQCDEELGYRRSRLDAAVRIARNERRAAVRRAEVACEHQCAERLSGNRSPGPDLPGSCAASISQPGGSVA